MLELERERLACWKLIAEIAKRRPSHPTFFSILRKQASLLLLVPSTKLCRKKHSLDSKEPVSSIDCELQIWVKGYHCMDACRPSSISSQRQYSMFYLGLSRKVQNAYCSWYKEQYPLLAWRIRKLYPWNQNQGSWRDYCFRGVHSEPNHFHLPASIGFDQREDRLWKFCGSGHSFWLAWSLRSRNSNTTVLI